MTHRKSSRGQRLLGTTTQSMGGCAVSKGAPTHNAHTWNTHSVYVCVCVCTHLHAEREGGEEGVLMS